MRRRRNSARHSTGVTPLERLVRLPSLYGGGGLWISPDRSDPNPFPARNRGMNVIALPAVAFLAGRSHGRSAGGRMMSSKPAPATWPAADLGRMIVAIAETADRAAFSSLYDHFAPRVISYLTRLGAPPNVAEELTQETLLTVWRKAAYFDPERAAASTWIFTIARNLRIDYLRRNRTPADLASDPSQAPDTPPGVDAAMISSEQDERVREALSLLSTEQADIVRLFYFQEKPHSEIARVLGLPLGTVKSRIRLALGRLRTLLDDLK